MRCWIAALFGSIVASAAIAAPVSEKNETIAFPHGVVVTLNSAGNVGLPSTTHLVLYALPNGNTTRQSFGYRVPDGPKPDHNIQHIGAQTRWLRQNCPDINLVVAYLECEGLGWPTWRRKNDPSGKHIAAVVDALRARFPTPSTTLTLTGHSGGGAFTLAYIDSTNKIPPFIGRITFLDSNYGYRSEKNHGAKLSAWLESSTTSQLTVLAYQDYLALDNGKSFVSRNNGTWGRSFAMLYDLSQYTRFRLQRIDGFQHHTAMAGRIQFILAENPKREILHSPQVAKNGFIHGLLTGTKRESKGYTYFGRPVYSNYISDWSSP